MLDAAQFDEVEVLLFKHLIGKSITTMQLCSDLICFISRYGSANLCLSLLNTLSDLYLHFDLAYFSLQELCVGALLRRLFSFLGPTERITWVHRYTPSALENLGLWRKLDLRTCNE